MAGRGDASGSEEEFHDAEEFAEAQQVTGEADIPERKNGPMSDEEAIRETQQAIDLIMQNKPNQAKNLMRSLAETSMYHSLGYATILWIQAIMTFERAAVEEAVVALRHCGNLCEARRRKTGFLKSLLHGRQLSHLNDQELHAEICHAESLLLRAVCTFVEDESLMSFVRGGMKVRESHNTYKAAYQFADSVESGKKVRKIHGEKGKAGASTTSTISTELNLEFVKGAQIGFAAFNLLLSLLPARVLRLLEFMGFGGDGDLGRALLDDVSMSATLRSVMASLTLVAYYYIIQYYLDLQRTRADIEKGKLVLDRLDARYANSGIVRFYKGRHCMVTQNVNAAIEEYEQSIRAQSEWVQLHHVCYWELMHAHSAKGEWRKASEYAAKLVADSRWSKSVYKYLEACYRFMDIVYEAGYEPGTPEYEAAVAEVAVEFDKVAGYKQRIAGKSIPIEKFAIRKARKFRMQGNYLLLPALEMMLHWHIFQYMNNDNLQAMLGLVLSEITYIQDSFETLKEPRHDNMADDLCLAYLLRGCLENCLGDKAGAEVSWNEVLKNEKGIILDHWIAPYARVELADLMINDGRVVQGREYLRAAEMQYKGYSMENKLHFRMHSLKQENTTPT